MKKAIHPQYNANTNVTCACGNTFTTGSTLDNIQVDICYACHPFFTREMRFVDRQGRVDRFRQKMVTAQAYQAGPKTSKKDKKAAKKQEALSFKDIRSQQVA